MKQVINNCDGCQAGYPLDDRGWHYIPKEEQEGKHPWSRYHQICTAHLYLPTTEDKDNAK